MDTGLTSEDVNEIPNDDYEATEAEGVAKIEVNNLEPLANILRLEKEMLAGLDEPVRKQLEVVARERGAAGGRATKSTPLSQNFVLAEFVCCRGHCTAEAVPRNAVSGLLRLVNDVLQPMRNKFGKCKVNSGYRNKTHNGHVGGASESRHRYDLFPSEVAADVTFASGTVAQWAAEARRLLGNDRGGVGTYGTFVHADLGPARNWSG